MFVKFSSVRLKTVSAERVDAHSGDVRDSCSLNLTDRDIPGNKYIACFPVEELAFL